ncbi:hypothetical protein NEMIN01_1872 [Nematocida minor]|uniref:uncharacterized protein n=1 Tax=Nematocida minor TaxID=1912983 RepID=UPI00221FD5CA|nr:uncharacterized protein NEMIN01_1872 [Nematocida minor]KAI5192203.1 hypothetical protein NEMIN01_1872 [Nematocida minor]
MLPMERENTCRADSTAHTREYSLNTEKNEISGSSGSATSSSANTQTNSSYEEQHSPMKNCMRTTRLNSYKSIIEDTDDDGYRGFGAYADPIELLQRPTVDYSDGNPQEKHDRSRMIGLTFKKALSSVHVCDSMQNGSSCSQGTVYPDTSPLYFVYDGKNQAEEHDEKRKSCIDGKNRIASKKMQKALKSFLVDDLVYILATVSTAFVFFILFTVCCHKSQVSVNE